MEMMKKPDFQRARDLIYSIREYILKATKIPSTNGDEQTGYNKKLQELYGELDNICGKVHIKRFRYRCYCPIAPYDINSVKYAKSMMGSVACKLANGRQAAELGGRAFIMDADVKYKDIFMVMEYQLVSQARMWLEENKKGLGYFFPAAQVQDVKETQQTVTIPNKEFYVGQEIRIILDISTSYFSKLKAEIKDFPAPIDANKKPLRWTRKDTVKIVSLINDHRTSRPRGPLPRQKNQKEAQAKIIQGMRKAMEK
ncbi:MAG: hypothetical protein ACE5KK_00500 [Candidatus Brocadiales bacterium]